MNLRSSDNTYDPIRDVLDEKLSISHQTIELLLEYRMAEKFVDLPGDAAVVDRPRLSAVFNELLDSLIRRITDHPSKKWVMQEFQVALKKIEIEDTECREQFGDHLAKIMDILGIESSDGLLSYYLGGV